MKGWRTVTTVLPLLAGLWGGQAPAAGQEDTNNTGWYLTAGGGAYTLEGWDSGTQGVLTLGRKLGYRHPDTPLSSVAVELELGYGDDPVTRDRNGSESELDVSTAGFYVASNTYVTQRLFHRVRLGLVYQYVEPETGGGRNKARVGFGLGAGVAVTERLELVADAGLQYWADKPMLFTGTLSARFNF